MLGRPRAAVRYGPIAMGGMIDWFLSIRAFRQVFTCIFSQARVCIDWLSYNTSTRGTRCAIGWLSYNTVTHCANECYTNFRNGADESIGAAQPALRGLEREHRQGGV